MGKIVAFGSEKIEEAYRFLIGNEVLIEDEAELDDYISAAGEWDGEDSLTHAVIFEGDVLMKADVNDDGDYLVYKRDKDGDWTSY